MLASSFVSEEFLKFSIFVITNNIIYVVLN